MKKTLIALMALAGVVMGGTPDFTSSITTGNSGNGNYYGATLRLTDTFVATTFTNSAITELPETLTLNAVTFYTRTSGNQSGTAYLALYEYEGDSTTGTFVGLSSNVVDTSALEAGAEVTFNFSGVTISSTKQYQMLFVNDSSTAENVATFTDYQEHAVIVGINLLQQSSLPSGDGTYRSSEINLWQGSYMPKMTIDTSSLPVVPEPATATLSLLALAGLAARRRRK